MKKESEGELMRRIQAGICANPAMRALRNNNAVAWTGDRIVRNFDGSITIHKPRPLHAGLGKGSSDLICISSVLVTQEMVGKFLAVFGGVEVKQPGRRPSKTQAAFIRAVKSLGGVAGVATSVSEARKLLTEVKPVDTIEPPPLPTL